MYRVGVEQGGRSVWEGVDVDDRKVKDPCYGLDGENYCTLVTLCGLRVVRARRM